MGVNPSNLIAARANPDKTLFPNLAYRLDENTPTQERLNITEKVDNAVRKELMAAGILGDDGKGDPGNYMEADWIRDKKEVPCGIFAAKYMWKFTRHWYYYSAEGPGIPPQTAEDFHKEWGTQVRVEGHCGCPSPLDYCNGFAVSSYHIDTQEGLNAFVKLLASIYRPSK